jgi:hypothetical protein
MKRRKIMPGPEDVCDREYFPGIITSEQALLNDAQLKHEEWLGPGLYMKGKGKVGKYFTNPDGSFMMDEKGNYKTEIFDPEERKKVVDAINKTKEVLAFLLRS